MPLLADKQNNSQHSQTALKGPVRRFTPLAYLTIPGN